MLADRAFSYSMRFGREAEGRRRVYIVAARAGRGRSLWGLCVRHEVFRIMKFGPSPCTAVGNSSQTSLVLHSHVSQPHSRGVVSESFCEEAHSFTPRESHRDIFCIHQQLNLQLAECPGGSMWHAPPDFVLDRCYCANFALLKLK